MQLIEHTRQLDILLVDDDEVDIMNVQRSFRKNNVTHRLNIARDGMEALSMLRTKKLRPQVILLDINMPRMNGLQFLAEMRQDPLLKDITVFIMSTSSNPADQRTAYKYHVAGYIIKPLTADEFGNSIGSLTRFFDICEFP